MIEYIKKLLHKHKFIEHKTKIMECSNFLIGYPYRTGKGVYVSYYECECGDIKIEKIKKISMFEDKND
jgi:hypothetical protein